MKMNELNSIVCILITILQSSTISEHFSDICYSLICALVFLGLDMLSKSDEIILTCNLTKRKESCLM